MRSGASSQKPLSQDEFNDSDFIADYKLSAYPHPLQPQATRVRMEEISAKSNRGKNNFAQTKADEERIATDV